MHAPLTILLMFGTGDATVARTHLPSREAAWINDGRASCVFDQQIRPVVCTQYYQETKHKLESGERWSTYRWMWKGPNGLEVRYTSQIGILGISTFTTGEVFDQKSSLPGHASHNAVSYSPNRVETVIGVPGDGYEFTVTKGDQLRSR